VNAVAGDDVVPPPPPPFDADKLVTQLQDVVVAAMGANGRPPRRTPSPGRSTLGMPDAKWGGGCWHCGKPGHARNACREFIALTKQHKG
jgi:hypothetical protein